MFSGYSTSAIVRVRVTWYVRLRLTDPVAVVVHSLVVLTTMAGYAFLPLLPMVQRQLGVSASGLSLLLALPSLVMIASAMPAGWLCDRWGPRRMTFIAAILFTVSCGLQADPTLMSFTLGRLLYGLAVTAIWTSGPAWLRDSRPASSGRVGAIVTSGAAGTIAGPMVSGLLAGRGGISGPYVLLGIGGALLVVPFGFRRREGALFSQTTHPPWTSVALQAFRNRELVAALAAMVAVGGVSGAVQLLVPLQLSRSGESVSAIGVAFAISGLLYVVVSGLMARAKAVTVTAAAAALGCLSMGLLVAPAGISSNSGWLLVCLLALTVPRAQLNTLSYRLAAASPISSAGSLSVVIGLLNLMWAISMVIGPVAAAWLDQGFGIATAFLGTASWASVIGLALVLILYTRRVPPVDHLSSRSRMRSARDFAEHDSGQRSVMQISGLPERKQVATSRSPSRSSEETGSSHQGYAQAHRHARTPLPGFRVLPGLSRHGVRSGSRGTPGRERRRSGGHCGRWIGSMPSKG